MDKRTFQELAQQNKFGFLALLLGSAVILMQTHRMMDSSASNSWEMLGESIGKTIAAPSFFAMIVAVMLNAIGFLLFHRPITLGSALFYLAALLLMPTWGFLGIPSMLLQFVAFAKMKNADVPAVVA